MTGYSDTEWPASRLRHAEGGLTLIRLVERGLQQAASCSRRPEPDHDEHQCAPVTFPMNLRALRD